MDAGFIVVDGSYLLMSIQQVWKDHPELKGHQLDILVLSRGLRMLWARNMPVMIRTKYYFKPSDSRVAKLIKKEDITQPRVKDHWQIIECGQNADTIPDDVLLQLPEKYRDIYPRAEKGVDMQLACDTLLLQANQSARNFVFLVNDRDYLPLFHAIQSLGGNTYLTGLDSIQKVRTELLELSDQYLCADDFLHQAFGVKKPEPQPPKQ